ncbi:MULTISPECIES: hypothetical protein [Leptolyngbya]|uniref:hypothetical protein n=1 Tax=Leptolyngbya TaxID=47251 RepID=UPI0016845A52|nr:hypothetical protein [Leptolyngbya sp. FACHB-1624]MBD1855320.1 hypothetical protein [Leptolyngbya sp. FACHB-1624]
MQNQTQTALFTELSAEEATQANGGFLGALAGYAVGRAGSNWWARNFVSNVRRGNIGGAIAVTDRNVNAILNNLRLFGRF